MRVARQTRADRRLDSRRRAFDSLSEKEQQGQRRPGSRNFKKGSALPSTHK